MRQLARVSTRHGHDEDLALFVGVFSEIGDVASVCGPAHRADAMPFMRHHAQRLCIGVDEINFGIVAVFLEVGAAHDDGDGLAIRAQICGSLMRTTLGHIIRGEMASLRESREGKSDAEGSDRQRRNSEMHAEAPEDVSQEPPL